VIKSFGSQATEDLYHGRTFSRDARRIPDSIWKAAWRKLDLLNAASDLRDLKIPSGNSLEKLKGNLKDFYSIRINDQYRIVFKFYEGHAYAVEIMDYH
jgi:proteic killer suppression protein